MKYFSARAAAAATMMFLIAHIAATPAQAGIADSSLPELEAGKTTLHLYSVPGVIAGLTNLHSFFSCTSTDTAPMKVGVELFGLSVERRRTMPR